MKKTILVCSLLCVCMSDVMTMRKNSVTFPLMSQLRTPSETSLQHLARVAEQMDGASQTSQSSTVTTQVPNVASSIELTMDKRMQEAFHYLFYAQQYGTVLFLGRKDILRYWNILRLIINAKTQIRKGFSVFPASTDNVKEKTASSTVNVASVSELLAQLRQYTPAYMENLLSRSIETALLALLHAEYNAAGLFARSKDEKFEKVAELLDGASIQVLEASAYCPSSTGRSVEPRIQPPREEQKQHAAIRVDTTNHAPIITHRVPMIRKDSEVSPVKKKVQKNKHKKRPQHNGTSTGNVTLK